MPTLPSRVFVNGNSQAVRIPQEFRIETSRVEISRDTNGDLIIHPVPADRGSALLHALEAFDEELRAELIANLEHQAEDADPIQERDAL